MQQKSNCEEWQSVVSDVVHGKCAASVLYGAKLKNQKVMPTEPKIHCCPQGASLFQRERDRAALIRAQCSSQLRI